MHEDLRHRVLGWWAGLISRRPGWVLFIAAVVAGASIAITLGQLRFQSDRNDLIAKDLEWNKRFLHWQKSFPAQSDLVVAVDTYNREDQPDELIRSRAMELVDELAPELWRDEYISEAIWGYDPQASHPKTIRLLPPDEFDQYLNAIAQSSPMLRSNHVSELIRRSVARMQADADLDTPGAVAESLKEFNALINAFALRMKTPSDQPIDLMQQVEQAMGRRHWEYLTTENQRLLLILLTPQRETESINPLDKSIRNVRRILDRYHRKYPDLRFGFTGIEVIETDETEAATRDSAVASIIAAVLIATLLVTAFHSFRKPLMLMTALGIAIAWSFGFLTLTIGHLQVVSVVFTVILLGLGVAFGIHIISRFELIRHHYPDTRSGFTQAIQDTFETIGPGMITGAVTTSAAFCTTMLTDFIGVAEMGMIAAAGVILCLFSMITVFPAMMRYFRAEHRHVKPLSQRYIHIFEEHWVMPFVRQPKWTLAVAAVITILSVVGISRMRFDYNLIELLPRNVDSVDWQRAIIEDGEQSIYYGVSIVDNMEQARALAKRYRELDTVESLGGVGRLIPVDQQEKLDKLAKVHADLKDDLVYAESLSVDLDQIKADHLALTNQLASLGILLGAVDANVPEQLRPILAQTSIAINRFLAAARSLDDASIADRIEALNRDYLTWRTSAIRQIKQVFDSTPIEVEDLPDRVMRAYIGKSNGNRKLAIEIFPKLPESVADPLHPEFLGRFITDMESVDEEVTGVIVQYYYSGRLIWTSYLKAGLYALIAVFLLVLIDFQSVMDATLTLVPVASGFAVTFGIMHLVGMQINPANIIVLPLMFGIGVDAGVHMLHRYRQDPICRPLGLCAGTGKGISLTSYTTMIGFGAMLIARHRGIASLGFVLALGIGMTTLACWTVMPALLELRTRKRITRSVR